MKFSKQKFGFLVGLGMLIAIAYSSSYTASWHIDDFPNIVRNEKIHIERISFDSMVNTFFAGTTGKLYRPVPMASFALNWYIGGADVIGFRIVNILIHSINGFLLYVVVLNLLQSPRLLGAYHRSEIHWIAALASVFWALNPVQTQAVTYIVQRMASMAALFYLTGIYSYLRYKKTPSGRSKMAFLAAIAVSWLLAVLSKENAVLFPISIGLIDTIFFPSVGPGQTNRKQWIAIGSLIGATLVIGLAFFAIARGNPWQFIESLYADRPFTAVQRLLTEARIVLLYLTLLFFPTPSRLSLSHDIPVSTSMLEPWTTFPAIVLIIAIVSFCIATRKNRPLISFAFLFFFLNHCVESTILPLELVFEHRNYLPSLFIFLPLAHGMVRMYRRSFFSHEIGRYVAVATVCLSIGMLCNWTFTRNMAWQSEKTLWEDEITKNPQLARPYHNLAWGHYQVRGQYAEALALYKKSLSLKAQTSFDVASTLNNMGRIYYLIGDYEQALHFFEKSINEYRGLKITEYQVVATLMQLGRWQDALDKIDASLQVNDFNPAYLKLKGIALAKTGDDTQSAFFLEKSLKQNPEALDTRAHLSLVYGRMGRFDDAASLFAGKDAMERKSLQVLLALSEVEKLKGNSRKSDDLFFELIQNQGIERGREILLSWRKDNLSLLIDFDHYLTMIDGMEKK